MILIRHGQSVFIVVYAATRVDPGIPDPRLTEEGRQQAAAIAADLRGQPLQRLISSPYTRALETAEIIAAELGLDIVVEPLVRERAAFHCDIGASPSELKRRFPRLRFDHLADPWWHDHVARGIAESEAALIERCLLFRRAMAAAPDWRQIAVVTHWGFIRAMTGRPVTNGERVAVDLSPAEATARQG